MGGGAREKHVQAACTPPTLSGKPARVAVVKPHTQFQVDTVQASFTRAGICSQGDGCSLPVARQCGSAGAAYAPMRRAARGRPPPCGVSSTGAPATFRRVLASCWQPRALSSPEALQLPSTAGNSHPPGRGGGAAACGGGAFGGTCRGFLHAFCRRGGVLVQPAGEQRGATATGTAGAAISRSLSSRLSATLVVRRGAIYG